MTTIEVTICDDCGEQSDDITRVDYNDICESCIDRNYANCSDCCTTISNNDSQCGNNGETICEDCYNDNYFHCEGCSETLSNDDYCEDGYCNDCHTSETTVEHITEYSEYKLGELLAYHTKPSLEFKKLPYENTLYLGVELELNSDSSHAIARETEKHFSGEFYLENDSTVDFEAVFTPMTLEYWRKKDIRKWLQLLKDTGATSYKGGDCGLHIHISRKGLKKDIELKLKYFLELCNDQLKKFSQRGDRTDYCKFPFDDGYNSRDRYAAINFQNLQTIEFRLYRGTLDYNRFWASLQMTEALATFCNTRSIAFFKSSHNLDNVNYWDKFTEYLKRENRYTQLYRYLETKNKAKNNVRNSSETGRDNNISEQFEQHVSG